MMISALGKMAVTSVMFPSSVHLNVTVIPKRDYPELNIFIYDEESLIALEEFVAAIRKNWNEM